MARGLSCVIRFLKDLSVLPLGGVELSAPGLIAADETGG